MKLNDDETPKLETQITPYGICDIAAFRCECFVCPPVVIRFTLTILTIRVWCVIRIDINAFCRQAWQTSGTCQTALFASLQERALASAHGVRWIFTGNTNF